MPGAPVINSFTANVYLINKGQSVTLSWNTSFGLTVKLNGAAVGLSGSKTVSPQVTTKYTLDVMGERGAATGSLTIVVATTQPPPTPPPPESPPEPPPVICTPGALKCIGTNLYVCNTSGTAWTLKQANSPSCKAASGIPDFWTDPIGWVIAVITQAWESMLGFVAGQFNLFLANIKNFQNNFMTQLVDFIQDPVVHVTAWVANLIPSIQSWIGEITKGISSWWASTSSTVMGWISGAVDGVRGWFADQLAGLTSWLDSTVEGVRSWFGDQIGNLQRGWDSTFIEWLGNLATWRQDFEDWKNSVDLDLNNWLSTKAGEISDSIKDWFAEQVTGYFNDALNGLNEELDIMEKEKKEEKGPWRKQP